MQTNNSSNQKRWATTPEDCFIFDKTVDASKLYDPIQIALSRALAILELLQCDGEDLKQGFASNQRAVIDSIFLAESQIRDAVTLLNMVELNEPDGGS
jgi:hypothetical protein